MVSHKPDSGALETAGIDAFGALATQLRTEPQACPDTAALARAAGLDRRGLDALVRAHAHLTPAAWLNRERTDAACRLYGRSGPATADAAAAVGFASAGAFERACLAHMRMRPDAYRRLADSSEFSLLLPKDYRAADILSYHNRDPLSLCESVRGERIFKALLTPDGAAILEISLAARRADCCSHAASRLSPKSMRFLHRTALSMLGLIWDTASFEKHGRTHPGLHALVAKRPGMRLPLAATPFDGLCWAIVGQQINLAFASALRRDLIALAGEKIDGMRAHPTPRQVAALDIADLRKKRFSRSKAQYLTGAAQAILGETLDVDSMAAGSAVAAQRRLIAVRGIGRWTARYMLMRGCGFADCAPVGDVALAAALQRFTAAQLRPTHDEVETLMRPFSPFRSLATAHLWTSLGDDPG
jgi:AraC family transcriptional regulator of adaptative response / DNA-3-methyladenine glycosylase II